MEDPITMADAPVDTVNGSLHCALAYSDKRMTKYRDALVAEIDSLQIQLEHFTSVSQSTAVIRAQLAESENINRANRIVSQRLRKLMHQISADQLTEMDETTADCMNRRVAAFQELHATAVLLRMAEKSATASRDSPELVAESEPAEKVKTN
jgi:hypothetical protein